MTIRIFLFFFAASTFFSFFFALSIFRLAKKTEADIIHCNWSITAFCALPAKYLLKIPIILTTRGSDLRLFPAWFNQFVFNQVNGIIDCFGPDYKRILNQFSGNFINLPVIVSEPEFKVDLSKSSRSKPSENFTIVMLSRFDITKEKKFGMAFFSLLEVISQLKSKYKLNCIFVGDGELKPDMETRTKQYDLESIVDFVGYKTNIYDYLNQADLVLGGVGLNAVSQEATLLGKVQLMPRIPFWYESIWFDKKNVLLYNPDEIETISKGIEFAINNPEQMRQISTEIIKTGKDFVRPTSEGGPIYVHEFTKIIESVTP